MSGPAGPRLASYHSGPVDLGQIRSSYKAPCSAAYERIDNSMNCKEDAEGLGSRGFEWALDLPSDAPTATDLKPRIGAQGTPVPPPRDCLS